MLEKMLIIIYINVLITLVLIAKLDFVPDSPAVVYLLIFVAIVLIAFIIRHSAITSQFMMVGFVITMFVAYIAPVSRGQLPVYDQHVTVHFLDQSLQSGFLPEAVPSNIRGWEKIRTTPLLYSFGTVVGNILDFGPFSTTLFLPLFVLPILPLLGAHTVKNVWAGLIWLTPVFFTFSAATAVEQMYVLPLIGILLISISKIGDFRYKIIFVFILSLLPIAHTYTPVVAVVFVIAYTIGTQITKPSIAPWKAVLGGVLIPVIWMITQNPLLSHGGELVVLGVSGIIENLQILLNSPSPAVNSPSPAVNSPFSPKGQPGLSIHVSRPLSFYIGWFLRFFFFVTLGATVVSITQKKIINALLKPGILALVVAGIISFFFATIISAVNLNRAWLMVTLFTVFASQEVFDLTAKQTSIPSVAEITSITLAGTVLAGWLLSVYYHMSTAGPLTNGVQQILLLLGIISLALAGIIHILGSISHIESNHSEWFNSPSKSSLLKSLIILLVLGHAISGTTLETYSSKERKETYKTATLPHYHTSWDYATANFVANHTTGPVVSDRRTFAMLEEYHRRNVEAIYNCYTSPCSTPTVIWFDSYTYIWQGITNFGPIHTSFKDNEFLQTNRDLVYSTGHSAVFVE